MIQGKVFSSGTENVSGTTLETEQFPLADVACWVISMIGEKEIAPQVTIVCGEMSCKLISPDPKDIAPGREG